MRVLGPGALADRIDALHAQPGFTAEALDVEQLGPHGQVIGTERLGPHGHVIGGLRVEARLVAHTEESYGIRVTAGDDEPGLVYSGDCGRADDLVPLIRPGDTLLAEASFGPGPVPPGVMHLDGPAVGRLAAATAAGRVLLTHLLMGHDPAATVASVRATFDGPIDLVWPGSRFEL
jgi:ribonuclease BN (tRNA processing enzyme)